MKATIWLRIASVLTFVHSVLHTAGGVFGKTPPGPASVAVAAMQANQFVFMGATRTFWEFQRGLGLSVTIFLTMEAVVFWLWAAWQRATRFACVLCWRCSPWVMLRSLSTHWCIFLRSPQ